MGSNKLKEISEMKAREQSRLMISWIKKGGWRYHQEQMLGRTLTDADHHHLDMQLARGAIESGKIRYHIYTLENLLDMFPDEVDLWNILSFLLEKTGDNRGVISANEMYARLKGDISSAESLANVSDPAPLTREKIEIKTAFELKRILDEYRCIPVVLAMESRSAGSMMGNANQIAKQIARKFPGEVQHVKVNLDSTHRVGSFFNVKFIEVGRGEMHLYTEPMTILAIHDGRVVIDWRAYGSYSAKDFYDDMAKYLETGIPIAEHPRTFKTAELLTFDYVHPVLEDFNQLHKPYPLLKRGE